MLLPSEIESKLLIPAVRADIIKRVVIEKGLKEEEVVRMLGITQAAVSNYLRGTRGDNELISKLMSLSEIMSMIKEIGDDFQPIGHILQKHYRNLSHCAIICDIHLSFAMHIIVLKEILMKKYVNSARLS